MKKYRVEFRVGAGKIPMIKLIRRITSSGLKEAKDFVEEKAMHYELESTVIFTVNHEQLGTYLIQQMLFPDASSSIYSVAEIEDNTCDLSGLKF